MSVAFKSAIDDAVLDELRAIIGDDSRVLPDTSSRVFRSRVPALASSGLLTTSICSLWPSG